MGIVALVLVLMVLFPAVSASRGNAKGELVGLFTITGGRCPGRHRASPCEDAMSGVVKLTSATGMLLRINVDGKNPLDVRLRSGRFSATLLPGAYQISDRVNATRGGGSCPVFLTGRRFRLTAQSRRIKTITIDPGKKTRVRINCVGH